MKTLLQTILLLVLTFAAPLAQSQTGSSIVIHDNASKANG